MPGVEENREVWDGTYDWGTAGQEWSAGWGDTDTQWRAVILPRLAPFLPASTVLEIAPGFGRWSTYLIPLSDRYFGVDLAASGIAACRERFADADHADFSVNDGRSLGAVPDSSIDLAFSFDSLVHVEEDVIGAYLQELAGKLAADGIAFIHHSNLGACPRVGSAWQMAVRSNEWLRGRQTVGPDHWRAPSMTAARFAALATEAGLVCVGQEVVNWLGSRLIDCISVAARPGSKWDRPNVVVTNPYFMAEAASAACVSRVYTSLGPPPVPQRSAVPATVRYFGPSSVMITSKVVGPWSLSAVGPWPRWRELLRRRPRHDA